MGNAHSSSESAGTSTDDIHTFSVLPTYYDAYGNRLSPGDTVLLVNLNRTEYNGKNGVVRNFGGGRTIVDLSGTEETKSFRPINCLVLDVSVIDTIFLLREKTKRRNQAEQEIVEIRAQLEMINSLVTGSSKKHSDLWKAINELGVEGLNSLFEFPSERSSFDPHDFQAFTSSVLSIFTEVHSRIRALANKIEESSHFFFTENNHDPVFAAQIANLSLLKKRVELARTKYNTIAEITSKKGKFSFKSSHINPEDQLRVKGMGSVNLTETKTSSSSWTSEPLDCGLVRLCDPILQQRNEDQNSILWTSKKPQAGLSSEDYAKDKHFVAQILKGLGQQQGLIVSLYDSTLSENFCRVDDLQFLSSIASDNYTDAKHIQKLKLSKPDAEWDDIDIMYILEDTIATTHFTSSMKHRLARVFGVHADDVLILDICQGCVEVHFTIANSAPVLEPADLENKMRNEFQTYVDAFVHHLSRHANFDINTLVLAPGPCKAFDNTKCKSFLLGPPGKQRKYHQPEGWTRIGLKVLGNYQDDTWLHPFRHPGNWYRAFHGTGRTGLEAVPQICKSREEGGGFKVSKEGKGKLQEAGVYVTPHSEYLLWRDGNMGGDYACKVDVNFEDNTSKQYRVAIQCAVNPQKIIREGFPFKQGSVGAKKYGRENREWLVDGGANVRPYGIIFYPVL